jgi:DNA-binding NarL/FixJ family response regulator
MEVRESALVIRLVLADDHPIVLDGLEQLFRREPDFEILDRCTDGEAALAAVRRNPPDVLVLDFNMPRRDGLAVARDLKRDQVATRVVLLTAALDEAAVLEAVSLGVKGIVLKEMATRVLVQAVRQVHGGGQWLERQATGRALTRMMERQAGERELAAVLTPREMEIVRMVASGLRNKEIASRLHLTEGTVKAHLHNIFEKLKIGSRLELTLHAQAKGLL